MTTIPRLLYPQPDVRIAQSWRWSIRVFHSLLPFAPGNRRAVRPCAQWLGIDRPLRHWTLSRKKKFSDGSRVFDRGPAGNNGPQFARGRRATAERGKVRTSCSRWCQLWRGLRSGLGRPQHKMGLSRRLGYVGFTSEDQTSFVFFIIKDHIGPCYHIRTTSKNW